LGWKPVATGDHIGEVAVLRINLPDSLPVGYPIDVVFSMSVTGIFEVEAFDGHKGTALQGRAQICGARRIVTLNHMT
jgi:hypothetical protein